MDIDNYSPLLTAAEFGQEKAFETLLKNDAFLSAVTKCGKTVLFLAAESNHHNIIMKVSTSHDIVIKLEVCMLHNIFAIKSFNPICLSQLQKECLMLITYITRLINLLHV